MSIAGNGLASSKAKTAPNSLYQHDTKNNTLRIWRTENEKVRDDIFSAPGRCNSLLSSFASALDTDAAHLLLAGNRSSEESRSKHEKPRAVQPEEGLALSFHVSFASASDAHVL